MNDILILTLLNINKISRKIVNNLINEEKHIPSDDEGILNLLLNKRTKNKRIPLIEIDEVKKAREKANNIIEQSKLNDINIMTILDDDFPNKLRCINNPPVIIFFKGNKQCILDNKSVAIIGTRKPTNHGAKVAKRLGYLFGEDNFVVISGLAKGCDELAHKGCIDANGTTLAVLPGGLDKIYPASNKDLAQSILENNGCLISEYPIGVRPFKSNFVERDRLQSALSSAIIVVQTGIKSGTMHTVNYGLEQNKILACYNNMDNFRNNEQCQGNIMLLSEKKAIPLGKPEDINGLKSTINDKVKNAKDISCEPMIEQIKLI